MKKYVSSLVPLIAVLIAICFTGCQKVLPPVPCYNAIPDTVYVGQSINFSSCTTGASAYYWNFGDGGFATTASATHIYTQPGRDTGIFYASDGPGAHKTFTIVIVRPVNTWTFKGATDTSLYAAASSGDTIEVTNFTSTNFTNVSDLTFAFAAIPATAGSYQVVNDLSTPPGANQVAIYLTTPHSGNYGSTGRDNATATISIVGGKVLISLPSAMMVNVSNPNDSAALYATIRQTQ
jgi:hypothetical protein